MYCLLNHILHVLNDTLSSGLILFILKVKEHLFKKSNIRSEKTSFHLLAVVQKTLKAYIEGLS